MNFEKQIKELIKRINNIERVIDKKGDLQKISEISKEALNQAIRSPDSAASKAGIAIEAILYHIYEEKNESLGQSKIKDKYTIQELKGELGKLKVDIPKTILRNIDLIQSYRNHGSHYQANSSEKIGEIDLATIFNSLIIVIEWYIKYIGYTKRTNHTTKKTNKSKIVILWGILILIIFISLYYFYQKDVETEVTQIIEPIQDSVSTSDLKEFKNEIVTDKEILKKSKGTNRIKRLAILYFDNNSNNKDLDILKKGIIDMLITDLSGINSISVVERSRLESIIQEQNLNNTNKFDSSTASKIGKLLGANLILTGSFIEIFGSFRIDARFIDVETGKILKSNSTEGSLKDFSKLHKDLVIKIISNIDVKLNNEELKQIEIKAKANSITFDDALLYSKALNLYDRGEKKKAKNILKKIIKRNPKFTSAINQLELI